MIAGALLLAASAPCLVSVALEPARAFVGEQVLYRVEILRRDDVRRVEWSRAPSFTGVRVEALPARARENPVRVEGRRYLGFEERRALFPVRAGELPVPGAGLRCGADGEEIAVPPARLRVDAVPEAGRPEGWTGLVGRVRASARVEPSRLRLGESARVVFVVAGEANVWDVAAPFDPSRLARVELLPHRPTLEREPGERLALRRTFSYDLVPRSPGRLELPPVTVPFFDPGSRRFDAVRTPALGLAVETWPAVTGTPTAPAPGPARPAWPGWLPWLAPAALVAGAAAVIARRRRAADVTDEVLRSANVARAAGDRAGELDALSRALRLALEGRVTGARTMDAEELCAATHSRPALREAADLLAELDRVRFAGGGEPPPSERIRAVLGALRRR